MYSHSAGNWRVPTPRRDLTCAPFRQDTLHGASPQKESTGPSFAKGGHTSNFSKRKLHVKTNEKTDHDKSRPNKCTTQSSATGKHVKQ